MEQKISHILKVFVLLLLSINCQAQKFEWVNFIQGAGTQWPVSMSVDQNGNQYSISYFNNEAKINSAYIKTSNSSQKGLVQKQNTDGKILWYKVIDAVSTSMQVYPLASSFNTKGNLIVVVASNSDIKIGKDTVKKKISSSSWALFLMEFNDTGKVINSNHLIDANSVSITYGGNKICNDKNDNLYIGLSYSGLVKVYDSTGTTNIGSTSSPTRNVIFKFSNSGRIFKWASTLTSAVTINSMKVDINENVYSVGYWNGGTGISFKGKTITNPQTNTGVAFIWDKDGRDKSWFYVKSSAATSSLYDIAVHDSNSVFVSGAYMGDSAKFDSTWKRNRKYGGYIFFARYDINGKLKWVKVEDTTYATSINLINYYSSIANYKDAYFYPSFYLSYNYGKPVIFDGQKYQANGYGINLKVDDRGNILWGFRTFYPFSSMGTDDKNNFYFQGGWVGDTIRFGSIKAFPAAWDGFIGKTFDYAIYRGSVYSGPYCAGDSMFVPYTKSGTFSDTNTFFAEISDEFGNFTGKEREIGRLKSKDDGTIRGVLPMFKVASSGRYRIRIRSTSPQAQSFYKEDSLRLLIYSKDKADPGPPEYLCYGDTIQISTYGGTKWTWSPKFNMNDSNQRQPLVWPIVNSTYKIIIDDSSGCGAPDTAYKKIILRKPLKLTIAFKDTTVCDTSVLKLPMHFEGGDSVNYHWQAYSVVSSNSWKSIKSGKLKLNDTLLHVPQVTITASQKVAIVLSDECTNKKDTAYLTINLLKPALISKKFKDTLLCIGNSIKWKAKSLYSLNNYQWQWKDIGSNTILSTTDSLNLKVYANTQIKLTLTNGCTIDSNIFTVKVRPALKAKLLSMKEPMTDTILCFGQSLKIYTGATGGAGSGYQFELHLDGILLVNTDSLILQSNTVFPNTGGVKKIMLLVTDNCSAKSDSVVKTITVNPSPVANFTFGPACDLSNTNFTFTGTQPQAPVATAFNWDFGSGVSSTLQNPSVLLNTNGNRKVTLTLTSNNGCKNEISKNVDVKPQAKAIFDIKDICEWDSARIINKSTLSKGKPTCRWEFGDGNKSTLTSPAHLYSIGGVVKTFDVKLVAIVQDGCSDSITKSIKVKPAPKADFTFGTACDLSDTKFTFTGIKPALPVTTTFNWKFNNKDSSTLENPKFLFAAGGTSVSILTLVSSNGCRDSIAKNIIVKPQSKADFEVKDVCEDSSAVFINKSTCSSPLTYNWKFGDGQKSGLESPRHLYKILSSTTFNVSLVAIVQDGCSDSITKAVSVNANPQSGFNYTKAGKKFDFTAVQPGNSKYRWLFGDGDSSLNANPVHTFTDNLTIHTVCLRITNLAGCISETCQQVSILGISYSKPEGFKIYPNPNSGNFNIVIEQPGNDLSIAIFDMLGHLVKELETSPDKLSYSINLDEASGIYLVKVRNRGMVYNQKVIVTK